MNRFYFLATAPNTLPIDRSARGKCFQRRCVWTNNRIATEGAFHFPKQNTHFFQDYNPRDIVGGIRELFVQGDELGVQFSKCPHAQILFPAIASIPTLNYLIPPGRS